MIRCTSCQSEIPDTGRFCLQCGTPLGSDAEATLPSSGPIASSDQVTMAVMAAAPSRRLNSSRRSHPSSGSLEEGRFLPGDLLAARYRIIALLGKGGMGEVYRADDLTLGPPVALKFLPDEASRNQDLLERFRNEVRIARKVSHPNVCRVYDVGEVEGTTFFTMEYVDGEDLGSLMRRIGRLPSDKALEMARQLCAGLAAAHAKGVIHRDLKPANVMLDGRGQVVITDFGLAAIAEQVEGAEIRSGTPAYMAPEQLAGKEVTARSDIYSLGLVLYELFTGRRAFSADSLADIVRTRTESQISRPSSHVKDLDPLIERVILRCLEDDPANRPASALSVAAALPGGDPLAAALAAGETPSPEMVAAAGETAALSPRAALLCFVAAVLGILLACVLNPQFSALERMPLEQSPEVLKHRAHDIIARLGYDKRPVDSAAALKFDGEMVRYLEKPGARHDWDQLFQQRPTLLLYNYRQSPRYMVANSFGDGQAPGIVTYNDPPPIQSGMINLVLDPEGRLVEFHAMPPQVDDTPPTSTAPDWSLAFSAAQLDAVQFQPAAPTWNSLASSDARAAWTGTWPGTTTPLRIEAASWRGKLVYFELISPWTRPARMQPFQYTRGEVLVEIVVGCMIAGFFSIALYFARKNYLAGRGDTLGATRLALFVCCVEILLWFCLGHFVPKDDMLAVLVLRISTAMFLGACTWVSYMSLEPVVRKLWPHSIIGWTRLLSGKLRDQRVGADLLVGILLGLAWMLIYQVQFWNRSRLGAMPPAFGTEYLMGFRQALGTLLLQIPGSILGTFAFFGVLVLLRRALRSPWLVGAAFVALWVTLKVVPSPYPWANLPTQLLIYSIAAFACMRFGLLTLAAAVAVADIMLTTPISFDFGRWYAASSLCVPLIVLALAAWSFRSAMAGRKLSGGSPAGAAS